MIDLSQLRQGTSKAVAQFWKTRAKQARSQKRRGASDQGDRGAVTGGAQMDGFVRLVSQLVKNAGVADAYIHTRTALELPGYFRATKTWDMLVVANNQLLAVVEAKSQVGSFGNNFNNRTEEAIGSAVDLWTAFREGAFKASARPWLGFLFLLQDCEKSREPVAVREPHFAVFEEFRQASYQRRYELLLRKLILERHYEAIAYLLSDQDSGKQGDYTEPAEDLGMARFASSLSGHIAAFVAATSGGKK